ncbi:pyrroloquinoline quinone precursor peptide PqqA [Streptomyces sp. A3M-1-3]|nr:pyrroloquinoline quinone precursor peptide PqqA [Streptomyces sp. A3M-1-3]MCP3820534.1 pyrroloquinoline quinone precursor peptide PqqA [Streptomyces sp. A3M-1-3]
MNETKEQTDLIKGTFAEETDETTWQAPDHMVVETALEVTGYSLNSR